MPGRHAPDIPRPWAGDSAIQRIGRWYHGAGKCAWARTRERDLAKPVAGLSSKAADASRITAFMSATTWSKSNQAAALSFAADSYNALMKRFPLLLVSSLFLAASSGSAMTVGSLDCEHRSNPSFTYAFCDVFGASESASKRVSLEAIQPFIERNWRRATRGSTRVSKKCAQ